MNSAYIYLQIYRLFDNNTPLPIDCGKYCKKACCKGDAETGMYLFPGEKAVYDLICPEGWNIIESDLIYTYNGKSRKTPLLTCDGNCDRYFRPLACRIFPLTPVLNKTGAVKIITDPRARGVCPLSNTFSIDEFDNGFVGAVRKAFVLLSKNKHVYEFLKRYTEYIEEYNRFFSDLKG